MLLPFIFLPIQLTLLNRIRHRAAFLEKASFRTFVLKYTFYVVFLMTVQCYQVIVIIFGSFVSDYYNNSQEDGFNVLRYTYLIVDQISFTALCLTTLIEPVFKRILSQIITKYIIPCLLCKKNKKKKMQKRLNPDGEGFLLVEGTFSNKTIEE